MLVQCHVDLNTFLLTDIMSIYAILPTEKINFMYLGFTVLTINYIAVLDSIVVELYSTASS